MNKKALEAGRDALKARRRARFKQLMERPEEWFEREDSDLMGDTLAAIEAYHAALPDEGGLVNEARVEAGIWEGETEPAEANPEVLTKLLNRLADALEATRAKPSAPTIIGMLDESGDVITTEAMLAVLKREGWVEISPGYRLVPEPEPKPTDRTGAKR